MLFLSLREEDPWWRFHYINWWFKWGWISQARLWRYHSIVPEQNDWKIPFLAEAGSDSQDKSTGMLRPKTGINCVVVMDFGKEDLNWVFWICSRPFFSGYPFGFFCSWIYIHVPRLTLQLWKDLIHHCLLLSINVHQQIIHIILWDSSRANGMGPDSRSH